MAAGFDCPRGADDAAFGQNLKLNHGGKEGTENDTEGFSERTNRARERDDLREAFRCDGTAASAGGGWGVGDLGFRQN